MCTCLSRPDFFTHTHTHTHTPHPPGADRCTSYIYQRVFVHTHTQRGFCVSMCVSLCVIVCVCVPLCVMCLGSSTCMWMCVRVCMCACVWLWVYIVNLSADLYAHAHTWAFEQLLLQAPLPPPKKKIPVLAKFPPDSRHKGMKPIYYDCNLNYCDRI